MKDPIVQEVRKARAELFARADHNLATVVKQVRKRQAASNRRVVKPPRRRTTAAQGCIKLAAPRDPVPERRL